MKKHYTHFDTAIGTMLAVATDDAITDLHIVSGKYVPKINDDWLDSPTLPVFLQLRQQLSEYLSGERKNFTVKLAPEGTEFQRAAWNALKKIPFGETRSYGEQAAAINKPKAVRAIGAANGKNPIAVVVPCHRVIGANGALTGYAGGLDKKAYLLKLEGIL